MMYPALPDLIFYDPTPKQFRKLMELLDQHNPSRLIYDVGCGCGRLTQLLLKNHYPVIGIDRVPRENPLVKKIVYDDATQFDYQEGSTLIMARPCHSNWTEETIAKADTCGVNTIFYISKAENVEMDLGDYYEFSRKLTDNIGRQKEELWIVE